MNRENRYLVIKRADIDAHLDEIGRLRLDGIVAQINQSRSYYGKPEQKYVVVGSDWPMYESVWGMIEAWVDKPSCKWRQEGFDMPDTYETDCGHMFSVIEGAPADNNFTFCCYCGRGLVQVLRDE